MAYIIGNTTVIDNNGALGAVSGNSLNLANNSNISAGGASSTTYNSSSPSVSTPTISPSGGGAVIGLLGGGGGGGGGQNNGGGSGYGSPGGQTLDFIDMSPGGNIGFLVGSGGNGGYYQPYGWSFSGQAGGRSYSPFPTNANIWWQRWSKVHDAKQFPAAGLLWSSYRCWRYQPCVWIWYFVQPISWHWRQPRRFSRCR